MLHILLLNFGVASAAKMEPFVVGGAHGSIVHWPFIAYIEISQFSFFAAACGGSLLSSQTVLTAAHCFDDFTLKKSLAGFTYKIYMGHSRHARAQMVRDVLDYETPKLYSPDDMDVQADICVLFLSRPVNFLANVRKTLLQPTKLRFSYQKVLVAAGWGHTSSNDRTSSSPYLKTVELRPRPTLCRFLYRVICAKNWKEYPYSGDSGGPVIDMSTRHQVGLVSLRDMETGVTVMTSVPEYWTWIEIVQQNMFQKFCGK
ncbi:chymotrypsin-1-like [Leguminivora glycinivorella]|uniref:chymotrypsin-1-like n=1 Tax=Leguminivora glycinivorella TaxID=1035111 RepID=UPI00200F8C56|nr:chymotrypsin-1-like [Leguminivora glycinivorella]